MEAGNETDIPGPMWVGVDLGGQGSDRSAIVVVEPAIRQTLINYGEPVEATVYRSGRAVTVPSYARTEERREDVYQVTEIIRMDQNAQHSETLAALIDVYARHKVEECWFDQTGVGRGFGGKDYCLGAYQRGLLVPMPKGVDFTAQNKPDIIGAIYTVVDQGRFFVKEGIPGAEKLRQEIRDYRYRQNENTGHVSFGSATAAAHDDLFIAAALAMYPTAWGRRPLTHSYAGVPITRPCRVIKRTINVPNPEETP